MTSSPANRPGGDDHRSLLKWLDRPADGSCDRQRWRSLICSPDGPEGHIVRHVALALTEFMDSGLTTFVGAERLAVAMDLSERATRTHLLSLERQGWVVRRVKGRGKGHALRVLEARVPAPLLKSAAELKQSVEVAPARDAGASTKCDPAQDSGTPTLAPARDAGSSGTPQPLVRHATTVVPARRAPYPDLNRVLNPDLIRGAQATPSGSRAEKDSDAGPPPQSRDERLSAALRLLEASPDYPLYRLAEMYLLEESDIESALEAVGANGLTEGELANFEGASP